MVDMPAQSAKHMHYNEAYKNNGPERVQHASAKSSEMYEARLHTGKDIAVNKIMRRINDTTRGKLGSNDTIQVTEYSKRWTKCLAKTQTEICVNTAKLDRSNSSITNTIIHEMVHYVDWDTNHRWDYTHYGQGSEDPAASAPYVIGMIAGQLTEENKQ
jgi:hypothetical protein